MYYRPRTFKTVSEREDFFRGEYLDILGADALNLLIQKGFLTAPASTVYHGNYEGGLFDHSVNVAEVLGSLTENCQLKWERPESPMIVGILHDLCKIDQYISRGASMNPPYEYNTKALVKGHGVKSVIYAQGLIELTAEETACIIYHMGAFVPESEWRDYTHAVSVFPNVLWTHTADMIASHVMEV